MEQELRKEAIRRHVLGGESPKDIYTSLNRSKEWFFKWLKRYQSGTTDWFKDRSKAPATKPSEISPKEREIIIATRTRLESEPYAQIGVSAIKWELNKLGLPLRSDSTIHRTIKREGLVKKNCLYSQGGRISLFHRGHRMQQYPPDGPCRPELYKGRWSLLLAERDGSIQPSGLHRGATDQNRRPSCPRPATLLESHGTP